MQSGSASLSRRFAANLLSWSFALWIVLLPRLLRRRTWLRYISSSSESSPSSSPEPPERTTAKSLLSTRRKLSSSSAFGMPSLASRSYHFAWRDLPSGSSTSDVADEPEPQRRLTPDEEVLAKRYVRLLAIGIAPDDALTLIAIPDIAAQAERLNAKGCPPNLIVQLLKGD